MGPSSIATVAVSSVNAEACQGSRAQTTQQASEQLTLTVHRWSLETTGSVRALISHLQAHPPTDVVVLEGSASAVRTALIQLRSNRICQEQLIVLAGAGDAWCEALADGVLPNEHASLEQRWRFWLKQRSRRPESAADGDAATRIGRWLFLRDDASIQPVRDLSDERVYRYPLLEALLDEPEIDSVRWLEHRRSAGLLEAGPLVDRIRRCGRCRSSQLNYVDLCPQCRSLEIRKQACLHCFVCGHVAAQDDFLRSDRLRCPNCQTRLRHIGTDYDRPLENLHCLSCEALVLDAAVVARCWHCGQHHDPGQLQVREIRSFRLSSSGRMSIRHGHACGDERPNRVETSRLISAPQFHEALAWQISIARQAQAAAHGVGAALLALQFITANSNAEPPSDQIDRLIEQLTSRLRDCDRLLQARENLIWLLRPSSSRTDLQDLCGSLHHWLAETLDGAQPTLQWRITTCLMPEEIQPGDGADLLQARLLNSLSHEQP